MRCQPLAARITLPFSLVAISAAGLLAGACAPAASGDREPVEDEPPMAGSAGTTSPRAGSSGTRGGSSGSTTTGGSSGSMTGGSSGSMTGGSSGSMTGGSTGSMGGSTGSMAGSTGSMGGAAGSGMAMGGSGGARMDGGAPDTGMVVVPPVDAGPPRMQTVVPVITIDSPNSIPNEPKVDGTIKIYNQPPATFSSPPAAGDLANAQVSFMAPMGIELRGRSTQGYNKKPYSIEIRDAAKMAMQVPLLGMPPEADYVLLACWLDRTCMRTALGFQLANEMRTPFNGGFMWHPKLEFVEVFLKGQYNGTYNWAERVKRDRYRVNIPSPAADMAAGDITGGYLLRIEFTGRGGIRDFTVSPSQQVWTYFYPRAEDITAAQKAYIKDWATKFEAACNGADREDPEKGYRKFIDVRSWVDYMIVRELAREVDSYRLSFYMTKLPDSLGGKVYAGPQWDFDRAFGNATYYDANKPTGGWSFEGPPRPMVKGEEAATFAKNIFRSPSFQKDLACRWKEVRKDIITTQNINAHLDRWNTFWAKPQERDEAKWRLAGTTSGGIPTHKPYRDAITDLKNWNRDRIAWMDSQLNSKCP